MWGREKFAVETRADHSKKTHQLLASAATFVSVPGRAVRGLKRMISGEVAVSEAAPAPRTIVSLALAATLPAFSPSLIGVGLPIVRH